MMNLSIELITLIQQDVMLIVYCSTPHSKKEMMAFLGLKNKNHIRKVYLTPLLNNKKIKMTQPNSKHQKYLKI